MNLEPVYLLTLSCLERIFSYQKESLLRGLSPNTPTASLWPSPGPAGCPGRTVGSSMCSLVHFDFDNIIQVFMQELMSAAKGSCDTTSSLELP